MHDIKDMGCPEAVRTLIHYLKTQGIAAYPVGGCVRDALLGIPPHDWDLAVETTPENLMEACKNGGYRTVPTGLKHGTVTVLTEAGHVECTACRFEGDYTDGRHPDSVTFTYRLADDLSRRDFTVNAMAAELREDGTFVIVDLFGGQDDLQKKLIRCVGDPHRRFAEDALRLMRAVRFCVKLGFEMEENTYAALVDAREGLARVSRERVADEMRKTLCSPRPSAGMALLQRSGLMPTVLPYGISPHGMGDLESLPCVFTERMGCLLRGMPQEDVRNTLNGLKLSNAEKRSILAYAYPTLPQGQDAISARRLRRAYGKEALAVLRVCQAGGMDVDRLTEGVMLSEERGDPVTLGELAVKGDDLLRFNMKGEEIKVTLDALLDWVIIDPEKNHYEILLTAALEWRY